LVGVGVKVGDGVAVGLSVIFGVNFGEIVPETEAVGWVVGVTAVSSPSVSDLKSDCVGVGSFVCDVLLVPKK